MSSPTCRKPEQEERSPKLSLSIASTMTVTDINKHAGELSTDEVSKIETVLNNSCQLKIPVHMLHRDSTRHHHGLRCHGQGVVQREGLDE